MRADRESFECMELIRILEKNYRDIFLNIFHVPNAGKRAVKTGAKLKKMGMKSGVADFIVMLPSCGYHALAMEYKTLYPRGRLTASQAIWLRWVQRHGNAAIVVHGIDEAVDALTAYFNGNKQLLRMYEI